MEGLLLLVGLGGDSGDDGVRYKKSYVGLYVWGQEMGVLETTSRSKQ